MSALDTPIERRTVLKGFLIAGPTLAMAAKLGFADGAGVFHGFLHFRFIAATCQRGQGDKKNATHHAGLVVSVVLTLAGSLSLVSGFPFRSKPCENEEMTALRRTKEVIIVFGRVVMLSRTFV